MCGRYTLVETNKLQERFKTINTIDDLKPNYNAAPTHVMPVVAEIEEKVQLVLMKWGLVPSWSKEPVMKFSTINARSEGVEDKPTYRGPFKRSRCIVPANGFYEWKRTEKDKVPHYFTLKDNQLFGFAGLYDTWHSPDGSQLQTFTIMTTQANEIMKPIHDRSPVMLNSKNEEAWLDSSIQDLVALHGMLRPNDSEDMKEIEVSKDINSVKNNTAGLINSL